MKKLLTLTCAFLYCALSNASSVYLTVEIDSHIAPSTTSLIVTGHGSDPLIADSRVAVELGSFTPIYLPLPNGNIELEIALDELLFDMAEFESLSIEGFDGCMYGFVPVSYPIQTSIMGWIFNSCPNVSISTSMTSTASSVTVTGSHVGNTNQSKNDEINSLLSILSSTPVTSVCSGTCVGGSATCLATDIEQTEGTIYNIVMVGNYPVPIPKTVPFGDATVKFKNTNSHPDPDTYEVSVLLPTPAAPPAMAGMNTGEIRLTVTCECVNPTGSN